MNNMISIIGIKSLTSVIKGYQSFFILSLSVKLWILKVGKPYKCNFCDTSYHMEHIRFNWVFVFDIWSRVTFIDCE